MSSQDPLRLRVSIQRNGVPEVKLVWPCVRSHDLTVSKLVAQINDVVPLESGEWGLEDYVVELSDGKGGSYECLHFQQVVLILKDEDQILIRCLQGDDLRRRRLSGRHQISADGKHLVDGLAFGRPWLRTPRDRPALELPPRKRPRASSDYEHDDPDEGFEDDKVPDHLYLEGPESQRHDDRSFIDSEEAGDDDSDGSYVGQIEEEEEDSGDSAPDVDEEVRLLLEDNRIIGNDPLNDEAEPASPNGHAAAPSNGHNPSSQGACLKTLQEAFPSIPAAAVEAEFLRQHEHMERTYLSLQQRNNPTSAFKDSLDDVLMGLVNGDEDFLRHAELGGLHRAPGPPRPLIQEVEDEGPDAPIEVKPANDNSIRVRESGRGQSKSAQRSNGHDDEESSGSDDTSSSSGSSSDDSSDQSDRDESNNKESSSDDDSSNDESSSNGSDDSDDSDDSDSGSSSDSSSSSDTDSSNSDSNDVPVSAPVDPVSGNQSTKDAHFQNIQGSARVSPKDTSLGTGLTKTQKRNARRRRLNALLKEGPGEQAETSNENPSNALQEHKARLLRAISPALDAEANGQNDQVAAKIDNTGEESPLESGSKASAERRSRVDMGAGRRLLFGALGLKAPKSKADADRIKQGLMKDVRPLANPRLADDEDAGEKPCAVDDPEEWRQRVTYRAVECCQEGIVLSEPPFPFKQRWDPQQQYKPKGKRKRNRNSQEFCEEYYDDSYVDEAGGQAKRQKSGGINPFGRMLTDGLDDEANAKMAPNSEGSSAQASPAPTGDPAKAGDILPALPADITSLAMLEPDVVREGMAITWKQMEMSKATRWQPEMVQKTGLVLPGSDGETVQVLLAVRDRENRDKTYDEWTGERVYDKFEVPDSDGEDEGADDGQRTLAWAEMMDPRVLQDAVAASQDEGIDVAVELE